ncbi:MULTISPECIES: hypothetical protein [Sphingobacterium]|jgi:uncharacterized membrane protein|uniref:hypothetical protein n=1 Tax=Sphingobacterium TaxID=28453 RepID=UPI0004E5F7AF|nr:MULTISPECIES: hypothetical protein [Sphingobacterium]CDS94112.1 conserved membrane hypothetical protein [Sphingobacterium sp. PM2-P1-29]SJN51297.1 hypothetical protein FM120_29930 [Sphingobacterium faecium PCAi_F2.5]HCU44478.1 DUF2157 domain-containing protein [Sphingobacterium sp.]UXD69640.1 DUF2157 domain-containing protein [Sphingobacterium faecium]WGQ13189.1 DUF2157 domain-containing protein [Sphingobacterium faecium]
MKKLDVTKQEKESLEEAIQFWEKEKIIDASTASAMVNSIDVKSFDWKRLARYAFWVALASLVFAVFSLMTDTAFLKFVDTLYEAPNILFCLFFAALAVLFYTLGFRYKTKFPNKNLSIETMMLIGVFATAACIGFLGKVLDKNSMHYSLLFLLSVLIYGYLANRLKSKLIWVFMLIALGIWFATETAYHSDWGFKFWGMNYPLRFTIFGFVLTLVAIYIQPRFKQLMEFQSLSYLIGLLYLMVSLWSLSIFGNYSDFYEWTLVRQYHIFYWGLLSTAVSAGLVIYGLKMKDNTTREIGFVFFVLNVYTRYVEYLWDNINRAIFFLILAISFWFVGRWAEKLWQKREEGIDG